MKQFDNIQTLTKRLNELGTLMATSKLNESELQEFEDKARSLYERVLILNYKSKEEKVYQKNSATKEIEEKAQLTVEKTDDFSKKENTIHDSSSANPTIEFDFSSDFEVKPESSSIQEHEKPKPEQTKQEKLPPQEDQNKFDLYYAHFNKAYKEANKDKLSNAKLNTLVGAFGLNDKLLFIRELFNNDSEDFNQTIELLDSYEDHEIALKRLSEVAILKNWDKEESTVNDFIHIINRRYVQ